MRADRDALLEFAVAGLANHDLARGFAFIGRFIGVLGVEIARCPGRDDAGDVRRIATIAQQMVGLRERDEALGVPGRDENAGRIVDTDGIIGRRMHHEQRFM